MQIARLDPKVLRPHPLHAKVYGDGADATLIESVRDRGILVPLVAVRQNGVYRLVAGHRRRDAALKLGLAAVEVRVREFESEREEHIAVVESNRQRVKTLAQILAEGEVLERLYGEEAAERQQSGTSDDGKAGGRGRKKTLRAGERKVSRRPETTARVARAVGLGSRSTYERLKAVAKVDPAALDTADRRVVGKVWREIKRGEREKAIAKRAPELVSLGHFSVIYADPPWRYEHVETANRAIENQYPTLSLSEIEALGVPAIAADPAILYLWASPPKLDEALAVVRAWGFRYRTCLVWIKDRIGMGYWARQRHELLLVATRGNYPPPAPAKRPDSVIEAPRGKHSEKPVCVYDLIEAVHPGARRVEIFARAARDGWASWGNEA